jgi:hypothetical protein
MREFILTRTQSADDGTFGTICIDGRVFHTAELPWRDNKFQVSCIPEGTYTVIPNTSPKFGACFRLEKVSGRSDILIHVGNYAGDSAKGYRTDVQGCILIGESCVNVDVTDGKGSKRSQRMVTDSKKAFKAFAALIGKESFKLIIRSKA